MRNSLYRVGNLSLLIGLLFSCKNSIVSENSIDLLALSDNSEVYKLSEISEKIDFIFLETSDSCLLKPTRKIIYRNGMYFIESGSRIYLFSANGSFLNSIGKIGRGPDEYISLADFDVSNDGNTLALLTNPNRKVFLFKSTGESLSSFPVDKRAINLAFEKEMIVTHSDNYSFSAEYSFCFYSTNGDLIKYIPNRHPYGKEEEATEVFAFPYSCHFYNTNGSLFAKELHGDTIYEVEDTVLSPSFVLSTGLGRYTSEIRFEAKNPRDYIIVNNLYEAGNNLVVGFSFLGKVSLLFHDKVTEKNLVINIKAGIENDVVSGPFIKNLFPGDEGYLLFFISAVDFIEFLKKNPEDSEKYMSQSPTLNESSNPVIVKFRFKQPK
jgi:hypothetical protein